MRRLQFFQQWQESGRAAAIEWARHDGAESARKAAEATVKAEATAADSTSKLGTEDATAAAAAAAWNGADMSDPKVRAAADIAAAARRLLPTASLPRPRLPTKCSQPTEAQFAAWLQKLEPEKFWAWLEDTDNATHFKSKEMLYFWSTQLGQVEFLRTLWVEFGCPGHGKGPWDGLGAMVKNKVSRDLTNAQVKRPASAPIDVPIMPRGIAFRLASRHRVQITSVVLLAGVDAVT